MRLLPDSFGMLDLQTPILGPRGPDVRTPNKPVGNHIKEVQSTVSVEPNFQVITVQALNIRMKKNSEDFSSPPFITPTVI